MDNLIFFCCILWDIMPFMPFDKCCLENTKQEIDNIETHKIGHKYNFVHFLKWT